MQGQKFVLLTNISWLQKC